MSDPQSPAPMPSEGRLLLRDFPSAIHDAIAERLALYTIGFSSLRVLDHAEVSEQSGTGTLVRINGRRAILTADHVAEQIQSGDRVGLLIDWSGAARRCAFDTAHLMFERQKERLDDGNGPDLALIWLPETGNDMRVLVDQKAFYPWDRRRELFAGRYPGVDEGFWFSCGVIAEGAQDLGAQGGFSQVRGVQGLCAIATRPVESERDGFDYLDIGVPSEGTDVPSALNGMSGSGLWQVLLARDVQGNLQIQDYLLSGVAFYEFYKERRLRCHGRRSIYEVLPTLLSAAPN